MIIAGLLAVVTLLGAGCDAKKTGTVPASSNTASANTQGSTNQTNTAPYEGQETRTFNLNFRDTYLAITGYPYVDKDYRPRLYNLIYVSTIYEPDDMVNLTDPSGKWKDIYEFSKTESRIYMPIGRSAGNAPIW